MNRSEKHTSHSKGKAHQQTTPRTPIKSAANKSFKDNVSQKLSIDYNFDDGHFFFEELPQYENKSN